MSSHTIVPHRKLTVLVTFFERAATVIVGLILMIVGLGLGVTMIMLPVGITIGLIGVAMVVGGLLVRIDE